MGRPEDGHARHHAVGWYAAHLAAESPRRLRVDFLAHNDATNEELLDVLAAAAAMLAQVATAATASARAYHAAGMADTDGFLAIGSDEILVHTWDAARGLGVAFAPPEGLAEPVLRRLFPWAPFDAPPWQAPPVGERPSGHPGPAPATRTRLGLAPRASERVGRHGTAFRFEPSPEVSVGRGCAPLECSLVTRGR